MQKTITKEEAAKLIQSGNRVVLGHAAATPCVVMEEVLSQKERYQDVEIVHMLSLGEGAYMNEEAKGHFRHNALFVGANARDAISRYDADYTPCFFHEVPSLFKEKRLKVDVAIIQVSPPDAHGYMSFGLSNDYTKCAAQVAKIVIAEVNDKMPRVHGDNFIHVDQVDYLVETSYPLHEIPKPRIGEVEKAIGKYCASLIQDGDTLQLGIGAIPDAVLLFLKEKKDLGIHTEMFSDGVLELVKCGAVNNRKKSLHPGKFVATFLMGTRELYDFVDDNISVCLYPVDYVNDPLVIGQNDNMVSINSCLQVDFMGQVSAESIGPTQFSGVGGQVDYVRGATLSKNGRSIIAMPSTASKGTLSRIVPWLDSQTAVTTSRNDVHYVVTEYGIAELKGKSLRQRAEALIHISHPDFREELKKAYQSRFGRLFI